jgi:hypothetical protein
MKLYLVHVLLHGWCYKYQRRKTRHQKVQEARSVDWPQYTTRVFNQVPGYTMTLIRCICRILNGNSS